MTVIVEQARGLERELTVVNKELVAADQTTTSANIAREAGTLDYALAQLAAATVHYKQLEQRLNQHTLRVTSSTPASIVALLEEAGTYRTTLRECLANVAAQTQACYRQRHEAEQLLHQSSEALNQGRLDQAQEWIAQAQKLDGGCEEQAERLTTELEQLRRNATSDRRWVVMLRVGVGLFILAAIAIFALVLWPILYPPI